MKSNLYTLGLRPYRGNFPHEALDIPEIPLPGDQELPRDYVQRWSALWAKCLPGPGGVSTWVVACGRRILPIPSDEKTHGDCLRLLSGRRHRVYSCVSAWNGKDIFQKTTQTHVQLKRLHDQEIAQAILQGWGRGFPGGYDPLDVGGQWILQATGQPSVLWSGWPLYETHCLFQRICS